MVKNARVFSSLICCAIAVALPFQASALELKASATLKAEVGLDDRTRALIAGLPTDIRLQVMKLLEDALPLIDQSVQSYLDRVNEILEVQVIHLSCAASGVGKSIVDDISHVIIGVPTPIKDLKVQSAKLATAFKKNSTPDEYRVAYADFLRNGNVTACSIPGADEALVIINEMRADATARTRLWNRLFVTSCQSAETCFVKLRASTAELINNSNKKDLDAVSAKIRFDKIDTPLQPGYFEKFKQAPYESRMSNLYDIQDELLLAKQIRVVLAKNYFDIGSKQVMEVQKLLDAARSSLNPNISAPNDSAITQVAGIKAAVQVANDSLEEAVKRDETLLDRVATLRSILGGSSAAVDEIVNTANVNKARIKRIAEESTPVPIPWGGGGGRLHDRN